MCKLIFHHIDFDNRVYRYSKIDKIIDFILKKEGSTNPKCINTISKVWIPSSIDF